MINYELSILIAILAFVYSNLLTDADMIFNWPYNKLDELFPDDKKFRWVFFVLIHCEKCIAGQLSFWIYFIIHVNDYKDNLTGALILKHLFFISFTILSAALLNKLYKKI